MNGTDPIDDEAVVAAVLRIRPDAQAIYRFGSTVTGYARPDSDVDIAVLAPTPLSGDERLRMMGEVSLAAHRDADIMDLRLASVLARFEVLHDGLTLHVSAPAVAGMFELRTMKSYQDLMASRSAIDADIARRGYVHG